MACLLSQGFGPRHRRLRLWSRSVHLFIHRIGGYLLVDSELNHRDALADQITAGLDLVKAVVRFLLPVLAAVLSLLNFGRDIGHLLDLASHGGHLLCVESDQTDLVLRL